MENAAIQINLPVQKMILHNCGCDANAKILCFMRSQKHQIQIALATNLSRSGLDHFIDNNNLNSYLDEHISMSEAAPKPNPEMLQEILVAKRVEQRYREFCREGQTTTKADFNVDSCVYSSP